MPPFHQLCQGLLNPRSYHNPKGGTFKSALTLGLLHPSPTCRALLHFQKQLVPETTGTKVYDIILGGQPLLHNVLSPSLAQSRLGWLRFRKGEAAAHINGCLPASGAWQTSWDTVLLSATWPKKENGTPAEVPGCILTNKVPE